MTKSREDGQLTAPLRRRFFFRCPPSALGCWVFVSSVTSAVDSSVAIR